MRILLVPLLALSAAAPAIAQTPGETPTCVRVGEITHRWIDGRVSLQIQVTNTCERPEHVSLNIKMLDSDGFLIEPTGAYTITTVQPGTDTVRTTHIMSESGAKHIARYEVDVEPHRPNSEPHAELRTLDRPLATTARKLGVARAAL
ncbi:MAG: hypothetical protein ACREM1_02835 [Longimicrobiales bacterium]